MSKVKFDCKFSFQHLNYLARRDNLQQYNYAVIISTIDMPTMVTWSVITVMKGYCMASASSMTMQLFSTGQVFL